MPTYPARACAHRGDNFCAPENTLPAFELAIAKGAHQIEFDLRVTRDGQLVVLHDETVDRTTNG
ncbi:MAG: glycerophosphodiester phosphodiesterase family protein, partial [Armatimonadota bacterium]